MSTNKISPIHINTHIHSPSAKTTQKQIASNQKEGKFMHADFVIVGLFWTYEVAATLVSFVAVALLSLLAFSLSVAAVSVALSVLISEFVSFAFSDSVFLSLACEWEINSFERKRFIDYV